ncbi:hypothetical protein ABFX02_01G016900 [Erythranthe guttata]
MGSKAVQFMLGATPPQSARRLFSFRNIVPPAAASVNKRFYGAESSLEPPDVPRLAETARISLTPQQVEDFAPRIRKVVEWFGQLQAVDLQSIEPAIRADTEGDNLRDDVPAIFNTRDAMIAAVPTFEDSYVKVPKVLNKK